MDTEFAKICTICPVDRLNKGVDVNKIIDQISNDTFREHHTISCIPKLFYVITKSSHENLRKWVDTFGIPKDNLCVQYDRLWYISEENLIYLLDIGLNPNIYFRYPISFHQLKILTAHGEMSFPEKLKLIMQYGYIVPNGSSREYFFSALFKFYSEDYKVHEFEELLNIVDFTEEDARIYVHGFIDKSSSGTDTRIYFRGLPYISHLSKKYNLANYIRTQTYFKIIIEFNESLD